jgi:hypothetical protein
METSENRLPGSLLPKRKDPGYEVVFAIGFHISELKIYDAPGSKTRLRKKEICRARQKVWIICSPRGILNGFVTLNTTANYALSRLSSNAELIATQKVLLKVRITPNIASL